MYNFIQQIAFISATLIVFISAGCKSSEPKPVTDQRPITVVDPATAGTISGTITFDGAPVKPVMIDMSQDPACPQGLQPSDGRNSGGLSNVFVYIKEGLGNARFALPGTPQVRNQIGCRYEIRNLPPGEYTMAAMTENRTEQTVKIKVGAQGSAKADFTFAAGTS